MARLARRPFLFLLALLVAVGTVSIGVVPASAAPVYELEGEWEPNTPGQPGVADRSVARGEIVNAVFRLNVNSDLPAPTNDPVPNVTTRLTLENGVFESLPNVCFTGAGYTPRSSLSADKKTMVCNIGTVHEGTAAVLNVPIIADGQTGSQINVSATSPSGQVVPLPPVPIVNRFGMDMLWGTPGGDRWYAADGNIGFDFDFTLYTDVGSDVGPSSVTYNLDIALANGQELFPGEYSNDARFDSACTPQVGATSPGHPYSSIPTAASPRHAPFLLPGGTCTLTKTGPTTFRLTLTGIDYSLTQVPTQDSAGNPLPVDRIAIASGQINLKLNQALASNTSAVLTSNAPVYRAGSGLVDTDDASNNSSTKAITLPGDWSHSYDRPNGGTRWDNSYEQFVGATFPSNTTDYRAALATSPSTLVGECDVLDTRFVDYAGYDVVIWERGDAATPVDPHPGVIEYYVGNDPTVTPGSGGYNPDAFEGCGGTAGWTRAEPADRTTIKAVRLTATAGQIGMSNYVALKVAQTIQANAPIGQDIWTWGATIRGEDTWTYPGRGVVQDPITATPGLRYNGTNGGRDLVRVIFARPAVTKGVDRPVSTPGGTVTFTLGYSANGGGAVPPTVDDYVLQDVMPLGLTYVSGSATPAPAVTTNANGQQVLTWNLDGVRTNVRNQLTYQALVGDVDPGDVLVNTVRSTLRGETSAPATANVTTSTNGYTQISKTADTPFIANNDGSGDGAGSWTVNLRSFDPLVNSFTDVIDVLPYEGDERGTQFDGDYDLARVEVLGATAGTTVYYTTTNPALLSDDPRNPLNGNRAGSVAGNAVNWTTTYTPNATAVRVIGPALDPGAQRQFRVHVTTDGASPADQYVNRAQGTAGHTRLAMRTSAPMEMAPFYSASLKKYVLDREGEWHDAQDATDYPSFQYGDTVRYRVVVTNTGQGTLTNVRVSDDKQPQLGAFRIASLAPGESESHEYEFVLEESTSGTVVNTASATADTPPDSGNPTPPVIPSDPAGIEVANYTTVKSSVPAELSTVRPGDKVAYTVKVTQQGDAPANAVFADDLSDVLDDATYNGDATASIGDVDVQGAALSWSGTVPDGQVATITYSVTVKPIAALRANGDFGLENVVSSPGCHPRAGQDADCRTSHDVGVFEYSKTSDPRSTSKVSIGETVTYTVQVKQAGTAAVPGATLSDDLSKVLDDATYNGDAKASSGSVSVTGSTLRWTGDLAVGASATITYSVTVRANGDNTLLNVVSSTDPRGGCVPAPDQNAGCTTTHTKTEFDLKLDKSVVSGPRATVGDDVRYRLQVANRGPGVAPAPITLTDKLPAGLELVSAKGKGWDCTARKATDKVVCSMDGTLQAGQKAAPVHVVATTTRAASGRKLVNVATVSVLGDTVKANNKDKAKVRVKALPRVLPNTGFRTGWL